MNKMCIKNDMHDYQVFDENKNDEEVEQSSELGPISNIG